MWDPKTTAVMTQEYTDCHTNHGVSSLLTSNPRESEAKEAPTAITEPEPNAGNVGILGACVLAPSNHGSSYHICTYCQANAADKSMRVECLPNILKATKIDPKMFYSMDCLLIPK